MSNYTVKLEGLQLLYHLLKVRKMDYKKAVEFMTKHNQDMTFLKEIENYKQSGDVKWKQY